MTVRETWFGQLHLPSCVSFSWCLRRLPSAHLFRYLVGRDLAAGLAWRLAACGGRGNGCAAPRRIRYDCADMCLLLKLLHSWVSLAEQKVVVCGWKHWRLLAGGVGGMMDGWREAVVGTLVVCQLFFFGDERSYWNILLSSHFMARLHPMILHDTLSA